MGSPKMARNEHVCAHSFNSMHTKSPTGSNFSKIFFEHLYTGWTVVVHLYCGFYLRDAIAERVLATATWLGVLSQLVFYRND